MLEAVTLYSQMADALESGWRARARPEQVAPDGDWWTIWLYLAGRGAGKSYAAANFVQGEVEAGRATRVALVGATAADIRDVMVEGPSGLISVAPDYARPTFEPSKRRLTWPNGAIATCFAEESDRLRGQNTDFAYCDEPCAWSNLQATWDMLMLGLRIGERPRCVVATTPRPSKLLRDLISREGKDVVITRSSSYANLANLAPAFFEQIIKRYEGTRLGRQEIGGELLEDIEGALWSRDMIKAARINPANTPWMKRIVVAIDPAGSVGEDSDETALAEASLPALMPRADWERPAAGLDLYEGVAPWWRPTSYSLE